MAAKYEVKVAHEVPPGTTASFQEFTLPKPFALVALRDECKNILGLGNDFPLYIVDHAGDKVLLRDDRHLQSKLARFSPETQDLKFWVGAASGPPPAQLSAEKEKEDNEAVLLAVTTRLLKRVREAEALQRSSSPKTQSDQTPSEGGSDRSHWDATPGVTLPSAIFPTAIPDVDVTKVFSNLATFPTEKAKLGSAKQCERALYPLLARDFEQIALLGVTFRLRLYISNTDQTLKPLQPDVSAYPTNLDYKLAKMMPAQLELFGELKDTNLTNTTYNHLEKYAQEVFRHQPCRIYIYCFAANSTMIRFFRFQRSDTGRPSFECTQALPFIGDGGKVLLGLLQLSRVLHSSRDLTEANLPRLGQVIPTRVLGQGRTVIAYAAHVYATRMEIVVKHFKEDETSRKAMTREVEYLAKLAHLAPAKRVPTCLAVDHDLRLLALLPIATTLSVKAKQSPPAVIYRVASKVVMILKDIHAAGIVHRDLSPSNIYVLQNDTEKQEEEVMVNDFGFAAPIDTVESFVGTRRLAAKAVIEEQLATKTIKYRATHDLESVVKLVYTLTNVDAEVSQVLCAGELRPVLLVLQKAWMAIEAGNLDVGHRMLLARTGDYDALAKNFWDSSTLV